MLRYLLVIVLATAAVAAEFTGTVTKVVDGDTVVVSNGDSTVRVRLYGVDSPEKSQDGGREARAFTSDLVLHEPVTVLERDIDRYGRVVGDVRLHDGRVLNQEIIRTGHGWWYQRYAPMSTELQVLEAEARQYHRGIWAGWTPPERLGSGERSRRLAHTFAQTALAAGQNAAPPDGRSGDPSVAHSGSPTP